VVGVEPASGSVRHWRARFALGRDPLSQGQPPKEVRRRLGLAASCEEGPAITSQKLDPIADVSSMAKLAIHIELCAEKRCAKFCNKLFGSVGTIAEAAAHSFGAVKPRLSPCPMADFMERRAVEAIGIAEGGEGRQRDEVLAWYVVGLAMAFADIGLGWWRGIHRLVGPADPCSLVPWSLASSP
jgi:hypothetical protein